MKNQLVQLLPLLQARERRARHRHMKDRESHDLALRNERQASTEASRLEAESVEALSRALSDAPRSALQAMAQLDDAAWLEQRAGQAALSLQSCQGATQQALESMHESALAHAREARRRELLEEAGLRLQRSTLQRLRSADEQRLEEQFSMQRRSGLSRRKEQRS